MGASAPEPTGWAFLSGRSWCSHSEQEWRGKKEGRGGEGRGGEERGGERGEGRGGEERGGEEKGEEGNSSCGDSVLETHFWVCSKSMHQDSPDRMLPEL